jgi:hypothetical protein
LTVVSIPLKYTVALTMTSISESDFGLVRTKDSDPLFALSNGIYPLTWGC